MRRRGRISHRDKLLENNAALRFYGVPLQNEIKPKRERAAPDPNDSEAPVLAAVGDLLEAHPQVILAVRQNSGSMAYEKDGHLIPVWFYKLVRTPEEVTLTDYWGFMRDGRPYAIECKRPSWKKPDTPREIKQLAFINLVRGLGGIAGFVRSADEAAAVLSC